MSTSVKMLRSGAGALTAGAQRLEQSAGSPRHVATSLVDVEATLRALDRTCLAAAAALIPSPELEDDICTRYRAAAAAWQAEGAPPPSHERQAEILACLHDAAATLRAAAESCHRARTVLEATYHRRDAHEHRVESG